MTNNRQIEILDDKGNWIGPITVRDYQPPPPPALEPIPDVWKRQTKRGAIGTDNRVTAGLLGEDSTSYARFRRTGLDIDPYRQDVTLTAVIELPDGFYDHQHAFMRFLGLDNYRIADGNEWRLGLGVKDGTPEGQRLHLFSYHKNGDQNVLWVGDRLPTSRPVHLAIDIDQQGVWVYVDHEGEDVYPPFRPASVPDDQARFTAAYIGIDGASNQTKPVWLTVHSVDLTVGA